MQSASTGYNNGHVTISGGNIGYADSGSGTSSIFNSLILSGGTIGGVYFGYAGVSIQGGTIGVVSPNGSYGTVGVSGGNIQQIVSPNGMTISGGTVQTATAGGYGDNFSSSVVTGGMIQTLSLLGGNSNKISGGTISNLIANGVSADIDISGGSFQFITNNVTPNFINITGTGLEMIGTPTDAEGDGVFHLSGTLTDGEELDAQYTQEPPVGWPTAELEFNGVPAVAIPVPEASTFDSLALMFLLSGVGLALRAYKRRTV